MNASPLSRTALAAIAFAALAGGAAVALGAAAAHGVSPQHARLAETASFYALFHAPAMIVAALAMDRMAGTWARRLAGLATLIFALGIVLFAGALGMLAFGINTHTAPFGGLALIGAWVVLAIAALVGLCARRSDAADQ
ncbi:MAG: DUF423 domain-containing protein [Alphaproteobacteria bacterium]